MMPANGQIFPNHFAADARLTCAVWVDFYHCFASLLSFAFQCQKEVPPSGIVNLFAQNTFGQSENVQLLDCNHVVSFYQIARNFVVKVKALILDLCMSLLQYRNRFASAIATFFPTRCFSLNLSELLLRRFKILEVINLRTVAQSHERFNASVHANGLTCFWQRFNGCFNYENDKPFSALSFDCASLNFTDYFLREFQFDRSNFGQHQSVFVEAETALRIAKRVISICAFETRETSLTFF